MWDGFCLTTKIGGGAGEGRILVGRWQIMLGMDILASPGIPLLPPKKK